MTLERLKAFDTGWGDGDVDALMEFMSEDCEYHASVGPDPGCSFIGKSAVRQGFAAMLAHDAECEPRSGPAFVSGDHGVPERSYIVTDESGGALEIRGCDIFRFVGDKIQKKDAFRKCVGEEPK